MNIIKTISIIACALALTAPKQSQASLSVNKVAVLSAVGIGVLGMAQTYYQKWCQNSLDNALFDSLTYDGSKLIQIESVEKCLSDGANSNCQNSTFQTPLFKAIKIDLRAFHKREDHFNLVKFLMQRGAVLTSECKQLAQNLLDQRIKDGSKKDAFHYYQILRLVNKDFCQPLNRYAMNLDPYIQKQNYDLFNYVGIGWIGHAVTCLENGADPNYQRNGISLLCLILDAWPSEQLISLNKQHNMINLLKMYGARDYNKAAYHKALGLYNYHVSMVNKNNAHKDVVLKYGKILEALEAKASKDFSIESSKAIVRSPKNVTFSL